MRHVNLESEKKKKKENTKVGPIRARGLVKRDRKVDRICKQHAIDI